MGAAMTGLRPIAELMFSDFFGVAWDMVANQIAKTRYMTDGQVTLPLVIRALRLEDDGLEEREDAKARIRVAEAALARLEELVDEDWVRDDTAERVRGSYRFRTSRFRARLDVGDDGAVEARSQDYQRLRRELLEAERTALVVRSAAERATQTERGEAPGLRREPLRPLPLAQLLALLQAGSGRDQLADDDVLL